MIHVSLMSSVTQVQVLYRFSTQLDSELPFSSVQYAVGIWTYARRLQISRTSFSNGLQSRLEASRRRFGSDRGVEDPEWHVDMRGLREVKRGEASAHSKLNDRVGCTSFSS